MKSLPLNFQRSKRMFSAGFLTAVAGIFLFLPTPAIHAGDLPSPPAWVPYEWAACNLYRSGINQESSNMQSAVKTLGQARQESTTAIVKGGGTNPDVLHNDMVIGAALLKAMAEEAKTPENTQTTQKPKSNGKNPVRPIAYHIPAPAAKLR